MDVQLLLAMRIGFYRRQCFLCSVVGGQVSLFDSESVLLCDSEASCRELAGLDLGGDNGNGAVLYEEDSIAL